jgi:hypothetical protein
MKSLFKLLCLIGLTTSTSFGVVQEVIVYTDGTTSIGLIDSLATDSVYFADFDNHTSQAKSLKSVYFIYNSFGKLLYMSRSFQDRLTKIEERGGMAITTDGDTLWYDRAAFNRNMLDPKALFYQEGVKYPRIVSLLELQLVRIDATVMEYSVRNGFRTTMGLFLFSAVIESWSGYRDRKTNETTFIQGLKIMGAEAGKNIKRFLPKPVLSKTGHQYQSLTLLVPVGTMAWMAYDIYFDRRTHYLVPTQRTTPYPRDMFLFSLSEWIHEHTDPYTERIKNSAAIKQLKKIWPFK